MSGPRTTPGSLDVVVSVRHLDARAIRRVAVLADCDPRTVTRALTGEPLRALAIAAAISRALGQLGYAEEARLVDCNHGLSLAHLDNPEGSPK